MSNVYYMKYMYYKEPLKHTPGIYIDRHTSRLCDTDSHSDGYSYIVFAPFFTHDARLASLVLQWILSMVRVIY